MWTRFHCDLNHYPRVCFSFLEKCSHLHFMNSAQGSIQKGMDETLLKPPEDNRSGRVWKWNHSPSSTLDHRNNVRQSWRKILSRDSHPVATEIPAQEILSLGNPATGRHWAAPVPSCSEHDAARLENAEVWIKWSRDCTTENINVNIILGFAILHLKYSTNPFILPPTILLLGCLFCLFFFFFCSFIKAHTIKYVQRGVRNIWKHLKKSKCET